MVEAGAGKYNKFELVRVLPLGVEVLLAPYGIWYLRVIEHRLVIATTQLNFRKKSLREGPILARCRRR